MKRQATTFVHVQVYELHLVGAVLAMPVCQADRLLRAGFIRLSDTADPPYVSTGESTWAEAGSDDMLITTPGAFVVRL